MNELWNKILASYTPEKANWEKTYPYDYYILRPLSFPLTWLAAKAGLTANQVTFITVLISAAGCVLLAHGTRFGLVTGGILIAVFNLVDCVDGNLARMNPSPSKRGAFLDSTAGYPYWMAYGAAGIGLYRMGQGELYLLAGFLALLFEVLCVNLGFCYDYFAMISRQNKPENAEEKQVSAGRSITGTLLYKVYRNFTSLIAHDFLFFVTALSGHLGIFLVVSAIIKVFDFSVMLVYYIFSNRK